MIKTRNYLESQQGDFLKKEKLRVAVWRWKQQKEKIIIEILIHLLNFVLVCRNLRWHRILDTFVVAPFWAKIEGLGETTSLFQFVKNISQKSSCAKECNKCAYNVLPYWRLITTVPSPASDLVVSSLSCLASVSFSSPAERTSLANLTGAFANSQRAFKRSSWKELWRRECDVAARMHWKKWREEDGKESNTIRTVGSVQIKKLSKGESFPLYTLNYLYCGTLL